MKLWRLTHYNSDEDQERTIEFFSRRKDALQEYETLIPRSSHESYNTTLKIELVETCFSSVVSLLNRQINIIRDVKDWCSDPRRAAVDKDDDIDTQYE